MKIAIITDIHHGPQSHTKAADWDGRPVMERFVEHARRSGADLILDLGDHISDTTREADIAAASEVAAVLSAFDGPRCHVLGNHDVENLSIADNEAIFGQSVASRQVDLGETRLILWQPGVKITRGVGFPPAAAGLPWLVDTLLADERPAIIATHVPLSGHSQIGNYYFERSPHYSTYPDHAEVRRAVEGTGRAALWLSGHVHWNTVTNVRGIQHLTIQSVSERFTTAPETAAAYADVEISGGMLSFTVHGNDPFHARLPFRASGERPWMQPMQPIDGARTAADLENA